VPIQTKRTRRSEHSPLTVQSVVPVKLLLTTYTDGAGKSETRLLMEFDNHLHFLHEEGVESKLRQPAGWLRKEVMRVLEDNKRKEREALGGSETDRPIGMD